MIIGLLVVLGLGIVSIPMLMDSDPEPTTSSSGNKTSSLFTTTGSESLVKDSSSRSDSALRLAKKMEENKITKKNLLNNLQKNLQVVWEESSKEEASGNDSSSGHSGQSKLSSSPSHSQSEKQYDNKKNEKNNEEFEISKEDLDKSMLSDKSSSPKGLVDEETPETAKVLNEELGAQIVDVIQALMRIKQRVTGTEKINPGNALKNLRDRLTEMQMFVEEKIDNLNTRLSCFKKNVWNIVNKLIQKSDGDLIDYLSSSDNSELLGLCVFSAENYQSPTIYTKNIPYFQNPKVQLSISVFEDGHYSITASKNKNYDTSVDNLGKLHKELVTIKNKEIFTNKTAVDLEILSEIEDSIKKEEITRPEAIVSLYREMIHFVTDEIAKIKKFKSFDKAEPEVGLLRKKCYQYNYVLTHIIEGDENYSYNKVSNALIKFRTKFNKLSNNELYDRIRKNGVLVDAKTDVTVFNIG